MDRFRIQRRESLLFQKRVGKFREIFHIVLEFCTRNVTNIFWETKLLELKNFIINLIILLLYIIIIYYILLFL